MFSRTSPFLIGANLPWINYGGDFGANSWRPSGGLSSIGVPPAARRALMDFRSRGVTALRWFLFCDGRAGIRFDGNGDPLGPDTCIWADVDAALDLAASVDMQLMPTLFDFHWCGRRQWVDGVPLKGRRRVIASQRARQMLLDRLLTPLFDRYGRHPRIAAWDIFNEPEWATFGLGTHHPLRSVSLRTMRSFLGEVAALAHARTIQPVTVGSASAAWLDLVRGLGLDFYQVHWYDHLERETPLGRQVAGFELDRPVLLGEFPTRGSARGTASLITTARAAGYTGAFLWSVLAEDHASDHAAALSAVQALSLPTSTIVEAPDDTHPRG